MVNKLISDHSPRSKKRSADVMTMEEEVLIFQELGSAIADLNAARKSLKKPDKESKIKLRSLERRVSLIKSKILKSNLRLVIYIVKKYSHSARNLQDADLIQEGNIGLMKAIDKYEWDRGYKFSTYAIWWIRQAVYKAMANQEREIRIPMGTLGKALRVRKLESKQFVTTGERVSQEEISELFGVSRNRAFSIRQTMSMPMVSLSASPSDSGLPSLAESMQSNDESPSDTAEREGLMEFIRVAMNDLTSIERDIIRKRFALDGANESTLQEIAITKGVSRERIRQLEVQALRKIRHSCKSRSSVGSF
jgi:RNA polymerase primary sigma factor